MKIALTIILLILIGAGAWLLLKNDGAFDTQTPDAMENTGEEMTGNDTDMSDHDASAGDENTSGTDAGMEFPTVDSGTGVSVDADVKVFNINGQSFSFDRSEIRVREGDTVTVNFTSAGGFHDFVIDSFDARTARVNAGESSSVTFVADQTGTFEYYCSVGNHRQMGMTGTLIVE